MISSWAFTSLVLYEKCPYAAKLKYVDRIKVPQNKYSSRGIEIHAGSEAYIRGETPALIPELQSFQLEFDAMRTRYAQGSVIVEQEWAHDQQWNISDWRDSKNTWLRLKLDIMAQMDPTTGLVVDVKSGKKFGNEIKHAEQGQLYAGVTFLRFPKLKKVTVELWYVDQNDITRTDYLPKHAAASIIRFEKRAMKMTTATDFPPRPSIFTCKYCDFRKPDAYGGTGDCKFAVNDVQPPAKKQWR